MAGDVVRGEVVREAGGPSGVDARVVTDALALWAVLVGDDGRRRVAAFRAVAGLATWAEREVRMRSRTLAYVEATRAPGARTEREVLMRRAGIAKARRVARLLGILRRHLDPACGTTDDGRWTTGRRTDGERSSGRPTTDDGAAGGP